MKQSPRSLARAAGDIVRRRWSRRTIVSVLLFFAVLYLYAFFVSAGHFRYWPVYNNYYDLLAEGFRKGQLNLTVSPSPELVAKANPLDPANRGLWLWDVSIYGDKYYLYWGPVPAILQALGKSILRIRGLIGDQYLVFFFTSLSTLAGGLMLARIARRFFTRLPVTLLALSILVFATANPALYLLSSPGVYQAAITAGQSLMLVGLLFAFDAVWRAANGQDPRLQLALAGMGWGLAIASRVTVGLAVALVIVTTALATGARSARRVRQTLIDLLAVGAPVAVIGVALLVYNKARFHSYFEFGMKYQMDTLKLNLTATYVVPNLYSYFLRTSEVSCRFPFVIQHWDHGLQPLPAWLNLPQGYWSQEPIVGMLIAVPVVWPAAWGIALVVRRFVYPSYKDWLDRDPRRIAYTWLVASLLICGTVTAAVAFCVDTSTMRYLGDITASWVLLGLLGAWTIVRRGGARKWLRSLAYVAFVGAAIATVVMGLLLGFQGYINHFERYNPWLYEQAVAKLSLCK